jgi:hypothetical protein
MNSAGNNSVTHVVISEEEQGQRLDNFPDPLLQGGAEEPSLPYFA